MFSNPFMLRETPAPKIQAFTTGPFPQLSPEGGRGGVDMFLCIVGVYTLYKKNNDNIYIYIYV